MLLMTVIRSSLCDSLQSGLEKPCVLETQGETNQKQSVTLCVFGHFFFTVAPTDLYVSRGLSDLCFENLTLEEVFKAFLSTLVCAIC